jgi:hypothetical protein
VLVFNHFSWNTFPARSIPATEHENRFSRGHVVPLLAFEAIHFNRHFYYLIWSCSQ